tara:strand:+ start:2195 stop:3352 length:1158 start_codon:yes stop_codon:yes gene_type:complete
MDYYTEHADSHIIRTNREEFDLLKSTAIYGSNGGGKSNFAYALFFMDNLVHNSFKDSLSKEEDRKEWNDFFRLCDSCNKKPSTFEVSFLRENVIYRYGFEVYDWKIVSEWLFKTEKRETLLFERTGQDFNINESSFKEGKKFPEVNSNVLFISYLAHHNGFESSKVFEFFSKLNIIDGLNDSHVKHVTRQLLKSDDKFNKWITKALKFLEINSVSVTNDEKLVTKHGTYSDEKILTGFTSFDLESEESEGTKKLIYLLGAIYDTLYWGKIFVIDEFDSKLHPNLSVKLIQLFHEFNYSSSQFIITAHDSTLLDKDIFRRDQIWFVDRDQFGASDLYPMSNFKATDGLRSMSDFRKKYLNSDFGAAESIEFTESFLNLTKSISLGR